MFTHLSVNYQNHHTHAKENPLQLLLENTKMWRKEGKTETQTDRTTYISDDVNSILDWAISFV